MTQFRKKPIVIEAVLNGGQWAPIVEWLEHIAGDRFGGFAFAIGTEPPITRNDDGSLNIVTLEGTMRANVGDWVIQGVKGELYPCKPEIFEATYEGVGEDANSCGTAMQMLQTWVVNHHPGQFDVSTARNVARVMIALTHEAPIEGETYEPPELL